ncbi:fam-c protein [Plasmodium vinckei]|uniref:Fam-c protein n=1 Tax=Plasmodium vinckei TaxID=5860 RepID=A0A6V7T723_PLAVN|nr:fam-c protein [Plasmodium vinckei]
MNKRIFSLVCITLYVLLAVSIHCSEQKVYNVGNKRIRGTKEINRRNEKNAIEFKCEIQLNNSNDNDLKDDINDKDYKDETYNSEYINEDDIYNREYVNNDKIYNRKDSNNDYVDDGEDGKGFNFLNIFQKDKKNKIPKTTSYSKKSLTHPYNQITEASSNNNESRSKEVLQMINAIDDYIAKNPEFLNFLLLFKQKPKAQLSNDKEYPPNATFSVRNILHDLDVKDQTFLMLLLRIIVNLDGRLPK